LKNGKQAVRGSAGDDFERAGISQFAKKRQEITLSFIDKKRTSFAKHFEVKVWEFAKLRMIAVPILFARAEIDQIIEMLHIAFAQKIVLKHRAERWREGHREFEWNSVVQ
jgi:hypothetical protein